MQSTEEKRARFEGIRGTTERADIKARNRRAQEMGIEHATLEQTSRLVKAKPRPVTDEAHHLSYANFSHYALVVPISYIRC
jgi:hypothetical protein